MLTYTEMNFPLFVPLTKAVHLSGFVEGSTRFLHKFMQTAVSLDLHVEKMWCQSFLPLAM